MVTQEQARDAYALITELDGVHSLLRRSLSILRERQTGPMDVDSFFAVLAPGIERLLKTSIGLSALSIGDPWPNVRAKYGHGIDAMDRKLREAIRERSGSAANPRFVQDALDAADRDTMIAAILAAASSYANGDRYWSLDFLRQPHGRADSPRHIWADLETEIRNDAVDMSAPADEIERAARRATVEVVERAIRGWIDLYRTAWVQGVFGPIAKQHSGRLTL